MRVSLDQNRADSSSLICKCFSQNFTMFMSEPQRIELGIEAEIDFSFICRFFTQVAISWN